MRYFCEQQNREDFFGFLGASFPHHSPPHAQINKQTYKQAHTRAPHAPTSYFNFFQFNFHYNGLLLGKIIQNFVTYLLKPSRLLLLPI